MMQNVDEPQAITQVCDRLAARFPELSIQTVRTAVQQAYARFDGRPVRGYVPVLVERAARENLAAYERSMPRRRETVSR